MHILLLLLLSYYYYFAIVIESPTRPELLPIRSRPDPNQKKTPRLRGFGSYIYGRGLMG